MMKNFMGILVVACLTSLFAHAGTTTVQQTNGKYATYMDQEDSERLYHMMNILPEIDYKGGYNSPTTWTYTKEFRSEDGRYELRCTAPVNEPIIENGVKWGVPYLCSMTSDPRIKKRNTVSVREYRGQIVTGLYVDYEAKRLNGLLDVEPVRTPANWEAGTGRALRKFITSDRQAMIGCSQKTIKGIETGEELMCQVAVQKPE